jgi:uncharacterized YigZ family protein
MLKPDEYLTLMNVSEATYKEKGSKFLAFAYPVESEMQIKQIIQQMKNQYHGARHHCYAYKLGMTMENYRLNDDGEPSSTAGKPILGQIQAYNLTNVLVLVVRYFGGTLLGTSGLIRAYKTASQYALNKAQIIKKTIQKTYLIQCDYSHINEVEKMFYTLNIRPYKKKYEMDCLFKIGIRKTREQELVEQLKSIPGLYYKKLDNPEAG